MNFIALLVHAENKNAPGLVSTRNERPQQALTHSPQSLTAHSHTHTATQ